MKERLLDRVAASGFSETHTPFQRPLKNLLTIAMRMLVATNPARSAATGSVVILSQNVFMIYSKPSSFQVLIPLSSTHLQSVVAFHRSAFF